MERAIPILPADDLRVAKTFSVDKLGFRVRFESTNDGITGILGLERGGRTVIIDAPMSGHGRDIGVSLKVGDVDRYCAEWSARVHRLRAPVDEAWGARTFDLLDPFGNTLFVIGPPAAADR